MSERRTDLEEYPLAQVGAWKWRRPRDVREGAASLKRLVALDEEIARPRTQLPLSSDETQKNGAVNGSRPLSELGTALRLSKVERDEFGASRAAFRLKRKRHGKATNGEARTGKA